MFIYLLRFNFITTKFSKLNLNSFLEITNQFVFYLIQRFKKKYEQNIDHIKHNKIT